MKNNSKNIGTRTVILSTILVLLLLIWISGLFQPESGGGQDAPIPISTNSPAPITPSPVPESSVTTSQPYYGNSYDNDSTPETGKSSSSAIGGYDDTYDEGYDDVYMDDEPDWDRYYEDDDYARGADDAMDDYEEEYGEDW